MQRMSGDEPMSGAGQGGQHESMITTHKLVNNMVVTYLRSELVSGHGTKLKKVSVPMH